MKSARRRPNFLIIMSDEHAPMWSHTYGHPLVKTPSMDRMAASGVTFDAAYANSPLCAPARAAFLTGRHVSRVRAWDNTVPLASDLVTWPYLLRSQGYEVVLTGKMHLRGPDPLHGFERQLTYCISSTRPETRAVQPWSEPHPTVSESWNGVPNAGPGAGEPTEYDDLVESSALDFLRDPARRDEPFALCVGFYSPHPPFRVPESHFSRYYPDSTDLPVIPSGHLDNLPPAAERIRRGNGSGWPQSYSDEEIRRARAAYYGLVTYLDDKVGRLFDTLEEQGLLDDTIVIYTSDHGEMLGEHGLWRKSSFYEQSARVPLIISGPGILQKGKRVSQAVSLVDVATTIADIAGVDVSDWNFDGDSLLPLIGGESGSWKDEAFSEYFAHETDRPQAMVRSGRWKLCYGHSDPPEIELYDLESDPGEFKNLANRREHSEIQERLMRRIAREWGDPDRLRGEVAAAQNERNLIRTVTGGPAVF